MLLSFPHLKILKETSFSRFQHTVFSLFSPFFFPCFHRAFCIGSIMFRAVFSFHRFHLAISCSSLIIYTFVLVCVTDFQFTIIYTFCVVFAHSYRVIMHFVIKEKKIIFLQKIFKILCWQNRPFWNKFVMKSWKLIFFSFFEYKNRDFFEFNVCVFCVMRPSVCVFCDFNIFVFACEWSPIVSKIINRLAWISVGISNIYGFSFLEGYNAFFQK